MIDGNPTILIVDDDDDVRSLLSSILEAQGTVVVLTAEDGMGALDKIRQEKVDMVISDYQMPGMTGVELYKKAKEIEPDLPFLMITGHHRDFAPEEDSVFKMDELIEKPFHPDRFYEKVKDLLSKQQISSFKLSSYPVEFIEVFIEGLRMFADEHNIEISLEQDKMYEVDVPITQIVEFTNAKFEGLLALGADLDFLKHTFPKGAEEEEYLSTEELIDWLGEVANRIVGNIKKGLFEYGIDVDMGTPNIIKGVCVDFTQLDDKPTFKMSGSYKGANIFAQVSAVIDQSIISELGKTA